MNIKNYLLKNIGNLKNKTVVVTGATGGIGKTLCKDLATLNANIIIIGRNINKLNELKNSLALINKSVNVSILSCDFLDITSVKNLIFDLSKYHFDYLIHNAGAYALPKENTSLGYNNVFQINTIVPFYITKKLIDHLKNNNTKILFVSSITAKMRKINKDDLQRLKNRPMITYGNSKRCTIMAMTKLCEQNNISYAIVHPGVSYTNITSNYKKFFHKIIKYPMKLIFISNEKATLNIMLGLKNDINYPYWIGPKYFGIWGKPKIQKILLNDDFDYIYQKLNEIYKKIETL